MTRAFVESMRCSIEEAETKTSNEDRIDGIDFGKLLVAMDAMKDCMKVYGMKRTTADLEHHCANAKMLYMATPPESRDYLSSLLQQNPLSELTQRNDSNHSQKFNLTFRKTNQGEDSSSPITPPPDLSRAQTCAAAIGSETTTNELFQGLSPETTSPKKELEEAPPCLLSALDRKKAKNSMFWLCCFVRYTYNVHRLVLQIGHDAVDASPMAFMKDLHPYFKDFYTEFNDAKAFLQLLRDYQQENYLDASRTSDLDPQAMPELRSFLRVVEVVMYMWTPAFLEMEMN